MTVRAHTEVKCVDYQPPQGIRDRAMAREVQRTAAGHPMCRVRFRVVAVISVLISAPIAIDAANSGVPLMTRLVEQFLSRNDSEPHQYRALRRLEADAGVDRTAWLEAWTEYSPVSGFRYDIVSEGGSESVRSRVLRAVLQREKELVARGSTLVGSIEPANYVIEPYGFDPSGLAKLLLKARRKDELLLDGAMFLTPQEGDLVRVEGRLVKSPSFWIKKVDVVRHYRRIQNLRLPVMVESTAHVRFVGPANFRMTYRYVEVDRRPIS